jgi:hypothetical protein
MYKNRKRQLQAMRAWYYERSQEPEYKSARAAYRAKYYWENREKILKAQRDARKKKNAKNKA